MHAKPKSDYHQGNFAFLRKGLWEKFPEPDRVRCRELLAQLLGCVVLNALAPRRPNERKN